MHVVVAGSGMAVLLEGAAVTNMAVELTSITRWTAAESARQLLLYLQS